MGKEFQCQIATLQDHPAFVSPTFDEAKSCIEPGGFVEIARRQIGSCCVCHLSSVDSGLLIPFIVKGRGAGGMEKWTRTALWEKRFGLQEVDASLQGLVGRQDGPLLRSSNRTNQDVC
jgi:hypothetical protein